VAIVSTPRTGNTWLRHLLSLAYDIPTVAIHNPRDIDWDTLPAACILQMHWHPIPSFLSRLEQYKFRVVVLARHPLDILISILHFSLHDPTARWLEGEEGNERPIYGAMPRSSAFLQYATGNRARALLSITTEWWNLPGAVQARYESLVADPEGEARRLVNEIGGEVKKPIAEALAATTIPRLRAMTQNDHHFWQGKAGLWKSLLTAHEAIEIARAHAAIIDSLGYRCDPDPGLDGVKADANWITLIWADLACELQNLRETKRLLSEAKQSLAETKQTLAVSEQNLAQAKQSVAAFEQIAPATRLALDATQQSLAEVKQYLADNKQSLQQSQLDVEQWKARAIAAENEVAKSRADVEQLVVQAKLEADELRRQVSGMQVEIAQARCEAAQLGSAATASQAEMERMGSELVRAQEALAQKHEMNVAVEEQLQEALRQLDVEQETRARHWHLRTQTEQELQDVASRLREFEDLGPSSIAIARSLRRMSRKHPIVAKTAKKILRLAG
jgi:hypothetical protein